MTALANNKILLDIKENFSEESFSVFINSPMARVAVAKNGKFYPVKKSRTVQEPNPHYNDLRKPTNS